MPWCCLVLRRLLAALTIPSGTYKVCRDGERVGVRVKDEPVTVSVVQWRPRSQHVYPPCRPGPGAIVAALNGSVQRLIGSLGVLYLVATIAPAFFLPPPPPGGAPVAEIASYYSGHRGALLIAGWFGLLAFPLGFAFVSGLGLVLRGTGAASVWLVVIALVSISVTLAVAAVQGILALAVPYVSGSAAPAEVKLLADITQLGFSATFAVEISYFLASGVLALRSPVIPNWLGYTAVIAAFPALLGSLGVIIVPAHSLQVDRPRSWLWLSACCGG